MEINRIRLQMGIGGRLVSLEGRAHGRPHLIFSIAALAVIYSAEITARALFPLLLLSTPGLLVALDANTHDVLLAGLKIPVAELFSIAVLWRFTVHFVHYLIGLWYGEPVIRGLGRRWPFGGAALRRLEEAFARFAKPAVFLLSDNTVSLLAGAAAMRPLPFAVLQLIGTSLHVLMLVLVLRHTHSALAKVISFIDGDFFVLTVVFVAAAIISVMLAVVVHRHDMRRVLAALRADSDDLNQTADKQSADNANDEGGT